MCPRSRGDAGLEKMGTYTWDVYLHLSICFIYIYGGIMMYNVGKTRIFHLFMGSGVRMYTRNKNRMYTRTT